MRHAEPTIAERQHMELLLMLQGNSTTVCGDHIGLCRGVRLYTFRSASARASPDGSFLPRPASKARVARNPSWSLFYSVAFSFSLVILICRRTIDAVINSIACASSRSQSIACVSWSACRAACVRVITACWRFQ